MQIVQKFFIRTLVILLAVQGAVVAQLLSLKPAHAAGEPEVVINEVMWMGSEASTADEWIELYNTSNGSIDLMNWKLTNVSSGVDLVIPSGTIPAHGYFLVSNYNEANASSVLNVAPDYVTTTLQLSNTCAVIALHDEVDNPVDLMGCDGTNYFAGTNTLTKAAQERNLVVEDGSLATSWHTSVGVANLDVTATNTLATPKFINDTTAPITSGAIVNDGSGTDIDFTANSALLAANWSGFSDSESGVVGYQAGVGTAPGSDNIVAFTDTAAASYVFTIPVWLENVTYYVSIKALNGVGLASPAASSDGVTLNTVNPNAPTGLTVVDTPNDNGGSLTAAWTASSSPDVTSYQLNYRQAGELGWTSVNVGSVLSFVISGLTNSPISYEVTVEAVDFNNQHSLPTMIMTGQAQDNLAPVLDTTKVVVAQNKLGTEDTVMGNPGASNEANVTVYVFDRNPSQMNRVIINSVMGNSDGSFTLMGIGDNRYGQIWLQLIDQAGNSSESKSFGNDIIAPNPPTLSHLVANCDACRVQLDWQDNGPDTNYYKVSYTTGGVQHRTLELSATSVVLSLEPGRYDFQVLAYDQFGNESAPSNTFSAQLTLGIRTTIDLINGQPVTRTEALSGAREVRRGTPPSGVRATLVPPAQAEGSGTPETTTPTDNTTKANQQDWARIVVVVVLLLVIAGSFYALSRSLRDGNGPRVVTDETASKTKPAGKAKPRGRRRRGQARR